MFGRLKEKLKGALSIFSRKAEEEAEVKPIIVEKEVVKKEIVKEEIIEEEIIKKEAKPKVPEKKAEISVEIPQRTVEKKVKEKIEEKDDPELFKIVHEVAHLANIPMPKVYIIPSNASNAFATGRNPKHSVVAVTEGILELLSEKELKGVIAHELSHIKNRDILIGTIAAVIAGAISYIAFMARWAAIFGGGDRDRNGGGIIGLLLLAIRSFSVSSFPYLLIHLLTIQLG